MYSVKYFKLESYKIIKVVGGVGAGKSSLLASMFGEMVKLNGSINLDGSFAYAPQQAWLHNASFKDNILFGKSCGEALYNQIISACALEADLNRLPARDSTQIGEKVCLIFIEIKFDRQKMIISGNKKGVNLSGGQKQRISIARAFYSNSDVLVLDDPLSAVDVHLAAQIFNQAIGPKSLMKTKVLSNWFECIIII